MVNKALRSEDFDQLQTFRFFIGDLSLSLAREHQKMLSSGEIRLTVYRGVALDREEFEKLHGSEGHIISTNGYLSTSRSKPRALRFAKKSNQRNNMVGVLFQIELDVQQLGKSVIYADIASLSHFQNEEEVLFDLNASFRLDSIEQDKEIQLVRMTATNDGEKITKDYIALTQQETEEQSVTMVFGRLMCQLGQYDKSQKYFEELLNNPGGEDLAWIEFNIARTLRFIGAWEEARGYYDRAYDRMMRATPAREKDSALVLRELGVIFNNQGKHVNALNCFQRALDIREKFYPSGHMDIAHSLYNIGVCYEGQKNMKIALEHYHQASIIYEKFFPTGHPSRERITRVICRVVE